MKMRHLTLLLCVSLSLTGCSALLERNYATVEPHSSKFWESEAAGTLRAENYQDIVNDLLILIGQHTESATVRLYNYEDDLTVADTLEQATTEVQQETPMGAYAVEYITASSRSQRGYYEISIQVSYRRTAEQIQAVVNATSTEALSALLEAALDEGRTELAVRVGYWGEDGQARVEETVAQLREARGLAETPPWTISYYPAQGPVGLIEFVMGGDAAAAAEENSENICTIPWGEPVGYIEDVTNGFYKIKYKGQIGYAKAEYLTSSDPHVYTGGNPIYHISGVQNSVYLRKTPSEPAEYICEIPVGAAVEYLGSYNGYDKVYYNGMVGYVTSAYVR